MRYLSTHIRLMMDMLFDRTWRSARSRLVRPIKLKCFKCTFMVWLLHPSSSSSSSSPSSRCPRGIYTRYNIPRYTNSDTTRYIPAVRTAAVWDSWKVDKLYSRIYGYIYPGHVCVCLRHWILIYTCDTLVTIC